LQSDELFAFNSANLTPAARGRIDRDVMSRIGQCASLDVVLVTGHTDRIGSQDYNQKLSERRAAAVKGYLVSKGVAADKIETMGMGKTAPAKFCPDSRNQAELIACLAPNRRVAVEVKGPAK
jgi:OmpA-OmpF porin, OOP family